MAELKTQEKAQPEKSVKASAKEERSTKTSSKSTSKRDSAKGPSNVARWRQNKIGRFIYDAYYELRYKVTWPTFQEARNMTITVIIVCAVLGAILAVWDFGLLQLFRLIIGAK